MENIDEIFKNKLDDWEINPSERANALFEKRLKKSKKIGFLDYPWRAAASVVLLAGLSYFVYDNMNKTADTLANTSNQQKNIGGETLDIKSNLALKNQNIVATESQNIASEKISSISKNIISSSKSANIMRSIASIAPKTEVVEIQKTNEKNEVKNLALVDIVNTKTDLALIETTQGLVKKQNTDDDELILMLSAIADEPANPDANDSIITFDENDKHPTVGNSKNLLAKYSNQIVNNLSVKEDGFLISEAKNIKQKYYWIKARLNNYN